MLEIKGSNTTYIFGHGDIQVSHEADGEQGHFLFRQGDEVNRPGTIAYEKPVTPEDADVYIRFDSPEAVARMIEHLTVLRDEMLEQIFIETIISVVEMEPVVEVIQLADNQGVMIPHIK